MGNRKAPPYSESEKHFLRLVGNNLKSFRVGLGLSGQQLAANSNSGSGTINYVEQGYGCGVRTLYRISKALNVRMVDMCSNGIKCTIYSDPCADHGFVHGAEAEELRKGIEEILKSADEFTRVDLVRDLQRLLDKVDARDSLAYCEHRCKEIEK